MHTEGRRRFAVLAWLCLIALASGCMSDGQSDAGADADAGDSGVAAPVSYPGDVGPGVLRGDGSLIEDPVGVPLGGTRCEDSDGDGYGVNCTRGPDCDDHNRTITDACYRCERLPTGCPCTTPGARRPCDVVTDSDVPGPDGVCRLGERVCERGVWTRCVALDGRASTVVPPSPCGSTCNPDCRVTTVCPTSLMDGTSTGLILGMSPPPGFCPPGSGPGGFVLPQTGGGAPGGGPIGCVATCGGVCCGAGETCYTYSDTNVYPAYCTTAMRIPPPPVQTRICGRACAAGQTHCGIPPNDDCCESTEQCRMGVCRTPSGVCRTNTDCPPGNFCDRGLNRCFPSSGGRCNCEGDTVQQGCLNTILAQGGNVINGIFRTARGQDARFLRFATYMRGIETNPTGCPIGRSNAGGGPFPCAGCTPTICDAYACFGGPRDTATIGQFANRLDWLWTQILRTNDGGGAVPDGDARFYYPWRGRIYDLGAPANRVVLFPITDHVNDSCLEPFEYTVWVTDNPNATTIAPVMQPDPNQWNQATLTQAFTQGWTRNPNAIGVPTDRNDLEDTRFGDAVADGMATVWALPCGFSFRYASIQAGNNGNPTGSCAFHSGDDELDAVAGLTVEGDSLSIFHTLPYGASAGPDGLTFSTQVRTADVYFLFDTTGSMGEELLNLRTGLTAGTYVAGCPGGIIGGIRCVIPDTWFGVGYFDDFPVSPYGWPGSDQVYRNILDITSNTVAAQTAVNALTIHNGNDGPESNVPALWATITGNGLGGYLAARTGCPAGRFGYPCFRPGTIPIVMMFTDAMYHNGPGDTYLYNNGALGVTSPRFGDAVNALNAAGAKVIVINSCGGQSWCTPDAQNHAVALANQTRSLVSGGAPAVYQINANGSGLGAAVINAVRDLANYSRMDVTAVALDNPATPGVDERCFVRNPAGTATGTVRLSNPLVGETAAYAAGRCVDPPSSVGGVPVTARQCLPGTQVIFRAEFTNNCVMAGPTEQRFAFDIVVYGNGSYELGRVPVTIVVPPATFQPSGTHTYTIDATTACGAGRQADWTQLQYVADTPAGTSMRVEVQTAATRVGLDTAPLVHIGTQPPSLSPMDIGAQLLAAGQSNRLPYLRVRFTLNSNMTRDRTPTLSGYRVLFNCIDGT